MMSVREPGHASRGHDDVFREGGDPRAGGWYRRRLARRGKVGLLRPHTIILDGFLGPPRRWEALRRRVGADVGPCSIFAYDSTGRTPLPALGQELVDEVGRVGGAVNLVGYSMGGMVIRTAAASEPALPIRRAVFMNVPHGGTWLACLVPTPGVRQMRPFDRHRLALADAPWDVPTMTVCNAFDGIILPGRNTRWSRGGTHVRCAVPIHIWPVWSRAIHRRVTEFLAKGSAETEANLI